MRSPLTPLALRARLRKKGEAAAKALRDKPEHMQALDERNAAVGRPRKAKGSDGRWAGGA